VAEVAFGGKRLALLRVDLGRDVGQRLEMLGGERLEQWDGGEAGRLHSSTLRRTYVNDG
jgi:hypothetical protein